MLLIIGLVVVGGALVLLDKLRLADQPSEEVRAAKRLLAIYVQVLLGEKSPREIHTHEDLEALMTGDCGRSKGNWLINAADHVSSLTENETKQLTPQEQELATHMVTSATKLGSMRAVAEERTRAGSADNRRRRSRRRRIR